MGTSAERSSSNTQYYTRGDLIPGIQVHPPLAVLNRLLTTPITGQWNGYNSRPPGRKARSRMGTR
jgi:hypothetical protein